mmetsp:Transcript_8600/g.38334  ORF Transcript_8600/g.38334 Transcript_8600/m.38334 type:complete len:86 (-) Transcript_8600:394-651(-)
MLSYRENLQGLSDVHNPVRTGDKVQRRKLAIYSVSRPVNLDEKTAQALRAGALLIFIRQASEVRRETNPLSRTELGPFEGVSDHD